MPRDDVYRRIAFKSRNDFADRARIKKIIRIEPAENIARRVPPSFNDRIGLPAIGSVAPIGEERLERIRKIGDAWIAGCIEKAYADILALRREAPETGRQQVMISPDRNRYRNQRHFISLGAHS